MNATLTRKARTSSTVPAVIFAQEAGVAPFNVADLVEPLFVDPVSDTVCFLTDEGSVECPTDFWASGRLARLCDVGWHEHTNRANGGVAPLVRAAGVSVEWFGDRPVTGWSETATVLHSLLVQR